MGCNRGRECEYCHEDHPKKARRRGKKKRRANRGAADADTECSTAADMPWGDIPPDEDSDQAPEETLGEQRGQTASWSQYEDIDISTAADAEGPMRPAPTPDPLVPLLTALEFLAPLPTLVPTPTQAALSHDTSMDSWHQEQYHIPSSESPQSPLPQAFPYGGKLTLWYHESTISLEVGDEKHIIPFLNCNAELKGKELEPLDFSVQPELPEGLHLDEASGVIKGITTRPTVVSGYSHHVVVASNSALSASTTIDIMVRPAGFWTCGADNLLPQYPAEYQ
jgi:hypothetical protein